MAAAVRKIRAVSRLIWSTVLIAVAASGSIAASGQDLTDTIPRHQSPLAQTFPPAVAEQTSTGTGKFVIFTREGTGKSNEWDSIAGAWECIPSRPDVPITKRVEFCHSSWNADALLNLLPQDNREGVYPRFVRLQVDADDRDYRVNLYDINYRTWDVRCIWQGKRLQAFGVMKGLIFCEDSENWFRLDAKAVSFDKEMPFIPLEVDGEYWLVRKPGEKVGYWSYDRRTEMFVSHFSSVSAPRFGDSHALLSADGKNRAWALVPLPEGDWADGPVDGIFLLQRDQHNEDIRVPVKLRAVAGSGRFIIPTGTDLRFTESGTVEFSASQESPDKEERVWSIEIATGKVTESVRSARLKENNDATCFKGAPEYLRPYLKNLEHFGPAGLAPAFLLQQGILKKQPEYPDCTAGVSSDGRYILYKAKEGLLADVFIYGDLQTKQTKRWTCPTGIKASDFMDFVWVETP